MVSTAVPLAPYTTLKVGGVAEYFSIVDSETALKEAYAWARARSLPVSLLGGGSNILVPDNGVRGLVVHLALREVGWEKRGDSIFYTAGAGVDFDTCIANTVAQGWWGLENLSHIPGTVGATPVQNVGAYGVEVADVILSVRVYDTLTDKISLFSVADCKFGYRDSVFKQMSGRYVVLAVTFRLQEMARPQLSYKDLVVLQGHAYLTPALVRETVMRIRATKFPDWHTVGTAGSFFKNPIISRTIGDSLVTQFPELPVYPVSDTHVKVSLGYILDKVCGLRGYRVGTVRLYEQQALVLVAEAGTSAQAIDEFAAEVEAQVYEITKIKIEREVIHW